MEVAEHGVGIIAQFPGHVDGPVQVDAHDGLELPQGQHHAVFGVVDIRNGVGHGRGSPGKLQFGSLLHLVPALGLLEVRLGIFVYALVHVEALLGEEDGIESLLDLGHHVQTGGTGLLNGQFDLVAGEFDALPELGVDQRHARADTHGIRIHTADFKAAVVVVGIIHRSRDIRRDLPGMQGHELVDVVHDGSEDAGHHTGHAAARPFLVVGRAATHVHHLFLDGTLIGTRPADLWEQGGIRALAGIFLTGDFLIGDLDGNILAEGDSKGLVQGKDNGIGRCRILLRLDVCPVLRSRAEGQKDRAAKQDGAQ